MTEPAHRLVFATHSTTLDNERGVATGWLPGALNGHSAAEVHATRLAHLATPYPGGESTSMSWRASTRPA